METAITWFLTVLCWAILALAAFTLISGALDAGLTFLLWIAGWFKEERSVPKETTSAEAQKFER